MNWEHYLEKIMWTTGAMVDQVERMKESLTDLQEQLRDEIAKERSKRGDLSEGDLSENDKHGVNLNVNKWMS